MRTSIGARALRLGLMGLALAIVTAAPSLADMPDVVMTITASSGRHVASYEIHQDMGYWQGTDFYFDSQEEVVLADGDVVLGTISQASLSILADPQVNLAFSVQAGEQPETQFMLTTGLLAFIPIAEASARADAAFTVLDFFGEGTVLTGDGPTGGAYLAQYNGVVPTGTTFAERIEEIAVLPPDTLAVDSFIYPDPSGYLPIGYAESMSAQVAFTLTSFGFASGSSNFEIIPEPTALCLLVLGALSLRRR